MALTHTDDESEESKLNEIFEDQPTIFRHTSCGAAGL